MPEQRQKNRETEKQVFLFIGVLIVFVLALSGFVAPQIERRQVVLGSKTDREITYWQEFLSNKPDYRDGWLELGIAHYRLSQKDEAKECFKKALLIDPNCEAAKKFLRDLGD